MCRPRMFCVTEGVQNLKVNFFRDKDSDTSLAPRGVKKKVKLVSGTG